MTSDPDLWPIDGVAVEGVDEEKDVSEVGVDVALGEALLQVLHDALLRHRVERREVITPHPRWRLAPLKLQQQTEGVAAMLLTVYRIGIVL